MTRIFLPCLILLCAFSHVYPKDPPPVVGLCMAAPGPDHLDQFLSFMETELSPGGINTLVLRVDFNYTYESYPNLRDDQPLTKEQVKKLVGKARSLGIALIPQVNLLGHQSWASKINRLLEEYPEFDETPSIKIPEKYEWPNEDGLYCKSYCPLHPEVHRVVFAIVDEIMEVFEADAFHAGMDEVFYIGMDECPRCSGKDRSELFAGEVNLIRDHLSANGTELWIWGDRLIDGKTTGLGMWEASENNTFGAIDLIPKDVVICDWHYERADPTAALFAMKGFRVITCSWNRAVVTRAQLELLQTFRVNSTNKLKDSYFGFMQTVWSPAGTFLDLYYGKNINEDRMGPVDSYREMVNFMNPED
ncbi:MAG: family 20 glycosylhydrolase [Bacteroidales bacterium]|nr:family 20 glycosylhydrolase [Bacteroidales bacterium]